MFQSPLMGFLGVLAAALLYHACVTAQDGDVPAEDGGQACYADVSEPYSHFATKTAYAVVLNGDDSEVSFPGGCRRLAGCRLRRECQTSPDKLRVLIRAVKW